MSNLQGAREAHQSIIHLMNKWQKNVESGTIESAIVRRTAQGIFSSLGVIDSYLTGNNWRRTKEEIKEIEGVLNCDTDGYAAYLSDEEGSELILDVQNPHWLSIKDYSSVGSAWNKITKIEKKGEKKESIKDADVFPWVLPAHDTYTDGSSLYTYHLLSGHPDRPILFLITESSPRLCSRRKDWDIICFPAPFILWRKDSPNENFNKEFRKVLKKINAEVVEKEKINGEDVKLYRLDKPIGSGILSDDKIIYDILKEADSAAMGNKKRGT